MSKFKVGDKVKLKSLEKMKMISKSLYGIPANYLGKIQGKVFTIKEVKINGNCRLQEDKRCFCFPEDFLEKADIFFNMILPINFSGMLIIEKGKIVTIEDKEEILDEVEKEYLRAVIKPFYKRVINIRKAGYFDTEYILINLNADTITLPYFKKGEMYKGMEPNKSYSLQELGL